MIFKIVRGDYFIGLVNYVMRYGHYATAKGDDARVILCKDLYSPRTAAAQLTVQAALAPERTKRAVHLIGRAERKLTDPEIVRSAEAGLAAVGLGNRPYLLVVHDDGGFHCVTVEVDEAGLPPPRKLVSSSLKQVVTPEEAADLPPGDVKNRSWDSHVAWLLTQTARSLEVELGLRQLGAQLDSFNEIRVPDWQFRREEETGLAPLQATHGAEIKNALDLATWDDRADALAVHGLGLRRYAGANKQRVGLQIYALGKPDHFCNGSTLGKPYGLGALEKRTDEFLTAWLERRESKPQEREVAALNVQCEKKQDAKRDEYEKLRSERRAAKLEHQSVAAKQRQRLKKIQRVVTKLRQSLLLTGAVCADWARSLCAIVRAELLRAARARHREDKERLPALPRLPTWREFSAQSARDLQTIAVVDEVSNTNTMAQNGTESVSKSSAGATPIIEEQGSDHVASECPKTSDHSSEPPLVATNLGSTTRQEAASPKASDKGQGTRRKELTPEQRREGAARLRSLSKGPSDIRLAAALASERNRKRGR